MRPPARPPLRHAVSYVFLSVLMPLSATGQSIPTAVPLILELPASVRTAGLNGAGVAIVGDAGSVFTNPAGLATIRHIGLDGAYRSAPGQAYLTSVALAWRVRQFDLGFGARVFDFGTNPGMYLGPLVAPVAEAREVLAVGSLIYRFGLIAFGASGKYLRRTVDATRERGISADAGITIAFFDIMALALSIQNLRGNWDESSIIEMPRLTRFGFTMNYVDPQESFRLMSTLEVQWPQAAGARVVLGGEGGVVVRGVGVIGRMGYAGRQAVANSSHVTYGGTLTFGELNLDYAYQRSNVLGRPAHQLGVRLTL